MGAPSDRASRYLHRLFDPKPVPVEQKKEAQSRADKVQAVTQRAIQRRKGF